MLAVSFFIVTLTVIILSVIMPSVIMVAVAHDESRAFYYCAECCNSKFHYAGCRVFYCNAEVSLYWHSLILCRFDYR